MTIIPSTVTPLAAIRAAIATLDEQRAALEEAGDGITLAVGLDGLRTIQKDLAQLARAVEDSCARVLPGRRTVIDGLGVAEKGWAKGAETWEPERLLPAVIRRAVDPDNTGELPTTVVAMDRITRAITNVAGLTPSHGWRISGLRDIGLDPDDYRTVKEGRTTVRIITAS